MGISGIIFAMGNLLRKFFKAIINAFSRTKGRYRFIKTDSRNGEFIWASEWQYNLIMNGTNTGVRLIAQHLAGDDTYPLEITSCGIGTGNTAPTDADTDLQTPVLYKDGVADTTITGNVVLLSFFLNALELANGTYNEFIIKAGTRLFARSLISPALTKGTNEDITVEYEITIANT